MISDSENPYGAQFVNKIYTIFPTFKGDPGVQKLQYYDHEQLSQQIPALSRKLPYEPHNHFEYLENMRKHRALQEQTVQEHIHKMKQIDFLEEVTKYYPEVGKAFEESENSSIALDRIYRESQVRLDTFRKELRERCDSISFDSRHDEFGLDNQENWAYFTERCESDSDPLGFLDLKAVKRSHSDMPAEFENEFRKEDDQNLTSPRHKAKKIVLYSTSKKYVFGFDKVENLMEPSMMEDELIVENGRDILREINNIHYENNSNTNFKFLNFSQGHFRMGE